MTASGGYASWQANFRWRVPRAFNIANAILERHPSDRLALVDARADAPTRAYTFGELDVLSNRLANVLYGHGVVPEDRVAIVMPQRAEVVVAHFAIFKAAAIAVPLFAGFGTEALRYRLREAGVRLVLADHDGAERVRAHKAELPALEAVIDVDSGEFAAAVETAEPWCAHEATHAEDPALLIYTSGTTGTPKGALHAHRVLLGHLPGVEMAHEGFPQPEDRFWTPADWSWMSGLLAVLLASLYHGVAVVAGPGGRFEPARIVSFMRAHGVRNAYFPPDALRLLRRAEPETSGIELRSVASGGEPLSADLAAWVAARFGCEVNAFYGQTEANLLVAGMASAFPRRRGAIGRVVPGHEVAIIDDSGHVLAHDETGFIAVRRPDPALFLGYWNDPEATQARFRDDWMLTGDLGRMDADGYVSFLGREDDMIHSAGYRIGPIEVEAVLAEHPAVAHVAVVGVPDERRGETVVACVVPTRKALGDEALASELQARVQEAIGAHARPCAVVFRDSLPMTATGKVLRRDLRAMLAVDRDG